MYVYCDSTSLEHYRPISLLTSWYKVIAALVKERLDKGSDAVPIHPDMGSGNPGAVVDPFS